MLDNFEILDSIVDSMAIINVSGEIIFTNKAWRNFSVENMGDDACTGVSSNYLSTCEAVKGEEKKMAKDARQGIQQVMDRKLEKFELEYPCHSPNENRWFILRVTQVLENPQLTLLAHINITNRKNSELEVEKNYNRSHIINERLNTTLYNIVHDIQNPLASIMGLINLTKSEKDIESLKEYLGLIEKGSSNLRSFVKETLKHITTMEELQSVNVAQVVSSYQDTIEQLLQSNSIDFKVDIQQNGEFHTNEIEFRSILSNLISNAIKYSDNQKLEKIILFSFASNAYEAVLKVEDNGIGIKKEDIAKIMRRNYQVNKKSSEGVGLGLHMVQRFVNNLEGSIKIHSELGKGSTFIVKVPNKSSESQVS
ncbi:HAMP domain-containing sensor histidine kinase [uncultured Cyclobacterium sp.]|mgnify:CR=1 FL=1|uniref:sensor histidine kinase n=1 Tax=uncultured Cyclobacterium sp. TaxID=453820 RepID=UPI0030ED11D8|tara:strand:+ start:102290 stop:103390 length:1101 start_codon:yes stop_codon:yes gene_type:complete